jgi:nucleoside-diphosphate-sugar epimerase
MNCIDRAALHPGEIINIGSGSQTAISTVIERIVALTGSTSTIRWNAVAPRSFDARRWEADVQKAKALLDWHPKFSIEEGLRKSIAWFRENLTHYDS